MNEDIENDVKFSPLKLSYEDVPGAGKQIFLHVDIQGDPTKWKTGEQYADIMDSVGGDGMGVYFSDCYHCFGGTRTMMVSEPWVQFPKAPYEDMLDEIFTQVVDAWNEKYAVKDTSDDNE